MHESKASFNPSETRRLKLRFIRGVDSDDAIRAFSRGIAIGLDIMNLRRAENHSVSVTHNERRSSTSSNTDERGE